MSNKLIVYISSEYTGHDPIEKVKKQIDAAEEVRKLGCIPIIPLLHHYWNEVHHHEKEFWLELDRELVRISDVVLRLPGSENSEGAQLEEKWARKYAVVVVYSIEELTDFVVYYDEGMKKCSFKKWVWNKEGAK